MRSDGFPAAFSEDLCEDLKLQPLASPYPKVLPAGNTNAEMTFGTSWFKKQASQDPVR